VQARGHSVAVDEPAAAGGEDGGFMPTELLFAGLASCFALALGHAARKRAVDLPGLTVEVTAERPGRELRYDRVVVTAAARAPQATLADLVDKAARLCWVSNTFAQPPQIEYRATEVP
jgi:uncharacterized OsmC-like protein